MRAGLVAYLASATVVSVLLALDIPGIRWLDLLPFHLCDLAIFVAAGALITRAPRLHEILYFWAFGGTVLAMATPDLAAGFPDPSCIAFFGVHGGVLVAAAVLTWGLGMRLRPGAAWRAFLVTNGYALLVAVVNVAFGTNYLYLCGKPSAPTLLDWLGPWPWYLVFADAVALGLFALLALPFRQASK